MRLPLMLLTTLALIDGNVHDAEGLGVDQLRVRTMNPAERQGLLATVVSVEDSAFHLAYTALICYALSTATDGQPGAVDLLHPLEELRADEQRALRSALIGQSWPAWARAPQHLRTLLGVPEAPLRLADAARQAGVPLATLANAAARDRLPTMQVCDRHLVYLETIREAAERGMLHGQRGRPRSRLLTSGRTR
jgi:hypothetical protein